jgi:hypothetical protein
MRPLLVIWLVAFLSLTNLSPVHSSLPFQQQRSSISTQEYWDLVGSTRQAVVQLKSQTGAKVEQELNILASQWDQVSAVEQPDGTIVQIHSEYLAGELRSASPDLEHLEKSLDTLLKAHQEYPQKVFTIQDIDPLKKILARPEFQWDQARTVEMPAWLGNLFAAITKFTDRIVFAIINLLVQGRSIYIVAGSILFTLILLYISRLLSRNLAGNAQLGAQGEEGEGIVTSQGALQRAQALSSQGDYRNAVRFLYLSSLLVLDEQGLLRYDRSRTNREVLRSVSSRPELADPLRDVIDVFDRVWYGYEPVDEQTYQVYREHVEELREKKE